MPYQVVKISRKGGINDHVWRVQNEITGKVFGDHTLKSHADELARDLNMEEARGMQPDLSLQKSRLGKGLKGIYKPYNPYTV